MCVKQLGRWQRVRLFCHQRQAAQTGGSMALSLPAELQSAVQGCICTWNVSSAKGKACQGYDTAPPLTFASLLVSAVRSPAAEAEALILESAVAQSS